MIKRSVAGDDGSHSNQIVIFIHVQRTFIVLKTEKIDRYQLCRSFVNINKGQEMIRKLLVLRSAQRSYP